MTRRIEEIEQDIRALSEEDRFRLVRFLTELDTPVGTSPQRAWLETAQRRYARLSLDKPDSSLDAAWLKEAEDRLAAYRAGDLAAVDADQVFRELGKRT